MSGDEAMHLSVKVKALEQLGALDLERATVISKVNAGRPADDKVRYFRRQNASQERILTMLPITGDEVIAFFNFGRQAGNIRRIILPISIQESNQRAGSCIDAGGHGRCLTKVAAKRKNSYAPISLFKAS